MAAFTNKKLKETLTMALSLRAKNLLVGGGLATFAGSVFAYTVFQMNKVRVLCVAYVVNCEQFVDMCVCVCVLPPWRILAFTGRL